ncbi:protein ripply2.2-like [Bombina bombina]|uniref:protein ripply2.2-like n=1 Tax=Bombina bombina TaxID=8345 RepID=UPI00235AF80B|nr:protein ripply2.2-like [Bombina bombina]
MEKINYTAGAQDLAQRNSHYSSWRCFKESQGHMAMGCNPDTRGPTRRRRNRPHLMFWRPWLLNKTTAPKSERIPHVSRLCENPQAEQRPIEYNHPVRLFWPKSKPLDNMYQEAADLLNNFPVQATISFYNDSESDTDNEDDSSEEEHDSGFESE